MRRPARLARPVLVAAVLLMLLAGHLAARAGTTGADWQPIGPSDQDVLAVAVAAAAPLTEYASTRSLGVFRTDDGGRTWQARGVGLPLSAPVDWLGVPPPDGSAAFALAGGALYLSSDGGGHWHAAAGLPEGAGLTTGWLDPRGPTVFVGGDAGLFRRAGSGSWRRVAGGLPVTGRVTFIAASPGDPSHLLVGLSHRNSHGGWIFRSTDDGSHWHEADKGLPADLVPWQGAWSAARPRTAWIADGNVYRTDDAGGHWRRLGFGLPPRPFVQALTTLSDDTLFAALSSGLYRLDPGATAWSAVVAPWPATALVHQVIASSDGGILVASGAGLFTGDHQALQWQDRGAALPPRANVYVLLGQPGGGLFAGGDDAVWRRDAEGLWQSTGPGLPTGATVRALIALPGPPRRLLCATDYGVYLSTPAVDRWTLVNGPLAGRAVSALTYSAAKQMVYAALADGGIYVAAATSLHWRLLPRSTRLGYIRVLLADQEGRWLLANGSRTADGGRTWHPGPAGVIALLQWAGDGGAVLAGTTTHGLFRSSDGGVHWSKLGGLLADSANVPVLAQGALNAVYALADGQIVRSLDGGATWLPYAQAPADAVFTSLLILPGTPDQLAAGTAGSGILVLGAFSPAALLTTPTATQTPPNAAVTGVAPTWTPIATSTMIALPAAGSGTPTVTPSASTSVTTTPTLTPTPAGVQVGSPVPTDTAVAPLGVSTGVLTAVSPTATGIATPVAAPSATALGQISKARRASIGHRAGTVA